MPGCPFVCLSFSREPNENVSQDSTRDWTHALYRITVTTGVGLNYVLGLFHEGFLSIQCLLRQKNEKKLTSNNTERKECCFLDDDVSNSDEENKN